MSYDLDDTIAAIATARGGAARGIVRLSGPDTVTLVSRCFTSHDTSLADVKRPTVIQGTLSVSEIRQPLPCDVYLWPSRRSYTREPVAELHTLGSPPLLEAVLATLCDAGVRVAEPGEFTMRAFLAGRLDLTQAEAVLGVIDADQGGQLAVALAQLAGGIARPMTEVRDTLLDLLAELEAGLDFVDEDIEFISARQLGRQLAAASTAVAATALQMASRSESTDAVRVVLLGEPNVGKSSLFNALAELNALTEKSTRREAPAIVSKQPGTTRDYLTARIDLQGIACQLVDTAGIEPDGPPDRPSGTISGAAQQMTTDALRRANIQLLCFDATRSSGDPRFPPPPMAAGDLRQIFVATKADAASEADLHRMCSGDPTVVVTSSRTGRGLSQLSTAIREAAASCDPGHVVTGTAVRCRASLRLAAASLDRARQIVAEFGGEELVSAEVRTALAELGKVVGAVYTDDLLDRIFSRFCIGK